MQALSAGSYVGGLGMLTPRLVRPQMAGRTGANVRGSVLDSYLGRGVRDTAASNASWLAPSPRPTPTRRVVQSW